MATETLTKAVMVKIADIEKEIKEVKSKVNLISKGKPKLAKLQGLFKEINISDKDLEEAKRSVFKYEF